MDSPRPPRTNYYDVMGRWIMAGCALVIIALVFAAQGQWSEAVLALIVAAFLLVPIFHYAAEARTQQAQDEAAFHHRRRYPHKGDE